MRTADQFAQLRLIAPLPMQSLNNISHCIDAETCPNTGTKRGYTLQEADGPSMFLKTNAGGRIGETGTGDAVRNKTPLKQKARMVAAIQAFTSMFA